MAIPADIPGWRYRPELLDADGTGTLGVVERNRLDARQGGKDRIRATARVRDGDRKDPGHDQEAGRTRGALMRTATALEFSGAGAPCISARLSARPTPSRVSPRAAPALRR